jgi:hypothetical protein
MTAEEHGRGTYLFFQGRWEAILLTSYINILLKRQKT